MGYFFKGKVCIQAAFICLILSSSFCVPFVYADKDNTVKKSAKPADFSPVAKLLEVENLTALAGDIITEATEKKNIALLCLVIMLLCCAEVEAGYVLPLM